MTKPVRSKPVRSKRWIRLVAPVGVVLLALLVTVVAYRVEQVDTSDAAFLAPGSDEGVGASRLTRLLRERGVSIQPETESSAALVAAHRGDVTLFIPAPKHVHPYYLRMLKLLPSSTRVVIVEPERRTALQGRLQVDLVERRLATRTSVPGCDFDPATEAGRAAVFRSQYSRVFDGEELYRCYEGALVGLRRGAAEVTVVGAHEPFRNDRIEEYGNSRLATGLLARTGRVIWLDRHGPERRPGFIDDPRLASGPAAPPSLGPPIGGSGDPDFALPGSEQPGRGGDLDLPEGGGETASGRNPLLQAFPPWVYAAIVLLALTALLAALAAARRLGVPISEPLPVAVRTAETITGRGRLYHRAKAREPALRILQEAARDRIAHLLDLPAGTDRAVLVPAVAQRTGWPPETVDATLYGRPAVPDDADPPPMKDRDLLVAAKNLDDLQRRLKENR